MHSRYHHSAAATAFYTNAFITPIAIRVNQMLATPATLVQHFLSSLQAA